MAVLFKKPILTDQQRQIAEDREAIEQTGQESEVKGGKVVSQLFKEYIHQQSNLRARTMELLHAQKNKNTYIRTLAQLTNSFLKAEELDWDVGYKVQYNNIGVVMHLYYHKRIFERAFRATREPLYDLNACQVFAVSASSIVTNLKNRKDGRTPQPQQKSIN